MLAHNALASRFIVDQLMPLLPEDSEDINLQVKWLHAMLNGSTTMTDPTLNLGVDRRAPTIAKACMGTQLEAYQPPGWSTARVRAMKTFGTFFEPRMHVARSRTSTKTEIMSSASAAMIGTMICMTPTMTSMPDVVLRLEARTREESSHSVTI
jgi:hypothetical protein